MEAIPMTTTPPDLKAEVAAFKERKAAEAEAAASSPPAEEPRISAAGLEQVLAALGDLIRVPEAEAKGKEEAEGTQGDEEPDTVEGLVTRAFYLMGQRRVPEAFPLLQRIIEAVPFHNVVPTLVAVVKESWLLRYPEQAVGLLQESYRLRPLPVYIHHMAQTLKAYRELLASLPSSEATRSVKELAASLARTLWVALNGPFSHLAHSSIRVSGVDMKYLDLAMAAFPSRKQRRELLKNKQERAKLEPHSEAQRLRVWRRMMGLEGAAGSASAAGIAVSQDDKELEGATPRGTAATLTGGAKGASRSRRRRRGKTGPRHAAVEELRRRARQGAGAAREAEEKEEREENAKLARARDAQQSGKEPDEEAGADDSYEAMCQELIGRLLVKRAFAEEGAGAWQRVADSVHVVVSGMLDVELGAAAADASSTASASAPGIDVLAARLAAAASSSVLEGTSARRVALACIALVTVHLKNPAGVERDALDMLVDAARLVLRWKPRLMPEPVASALALQLHHSSTEAHEAVLREFAELCREAPRCHAFAAAYSHVGLNDAASLAAMEEGALWLAQAAAMGSAPAAAALGDMFWEGTFLPRNEAAASLLHAQAFLLGRRELLTDAYMRGLTPEQRIAWHATGETPAEAAAALRNAASARQAQQERRALEMELRKRLGEDKLRELQGLARQQRNGSAVAGTGTSAPGSSAPGSSAPGASASSPPLPPAPAAGGDESKG